MSLDKPLDLEFVGKGTYGVIMKKTTNSFNYIIKQFRVEIYDDGTTSFEREVLYTKMANNINDDIFINIIKDEISSINLAKQIDIIVPFINCISLNNFGYIHMEYMNEGDLNKFLNNENEFDLSGILGCYLNGLNILHNELKIIHGDLTPNNLLVNYVGGNYKQKIVIDDEIYYFDTKGYNYKIADFGLAEHIINTIDKEVYWNYLYRDYLLLYYLYFNKNKFNNYNKFINLIELPIAQINEDIYDIYKKTNKYKRCFNEEFTYSSVCKFMNKFLEIEFDDPLLYKIPKILLKEFIDLDII